MARLSGAHAVAVWLLMACGGGTAPPPEPGTTRGTPPDLRGRRVLVLPVQNVIAVAGDVDAEMAFGLRDRSREVTWVLAQEVDEILARSPGVEARTRDLPVGHFLLAEVRRVGDPLFGQLRRLAALADAEAIVLPVAAIAQADSLGSDPTVRLTVALIDSRTGRVAWFGVLEGGAFPEGDPRALASAVDALARTLLWYAGGGSPPVREYRR